MYVYIHCTEKVQVHLHVLYVHFVCLFAYMYIVCIMLIMKYMYMYIVSQQKPLVEWSIKWKY